MCDDQDISFLSKVGRHTNKANGREIVQILYVCLCQRYRPKVDKVNQRYCIFLNTLGFILTEQMLCECTFSLQVQLPVTCCCCCRSRALICSLVLVFQPQQSTKCSAESVRRQSEYFPQLSVCKSHIVKESFQRPKSLLEGM